MYLSTLKLWNFRKFGGEHFDLNTPHLNVTFSPGVNLLIGENDSGKTAIVDSIKLLLRTHSYEWGIRIQWEDFYQKSTRLRIEAVFEQLSDEEAKNFTEWLDWKGTEEDPIPYLRLVYDVSRNMGELKILPADIRAGSDDDGYLLDASAKEYLKITYLKPLRDAESELVAKKGSRLSQILIGHEAFKNSDEHHLTQLFKETNAGIKLYFVGTDQHGTPLEDLKGKELKILIDGFVKEFYQKDKESQLDISQPNIKEILEKLELSIKGIYSPGLGTLNRLFMAVELLHLNKTNWSGVRLGVVEELEAHLHPQVQMLVIEALDRLVKKNKKDGFMLQLIMTTHSPNIASKVSLNSLILCNSNNVFPMDTGQTLLEPTDTVFLEKFLDVTKANLFFAKGVIFVEGWSEEILLPSLAKKLGINLTEHGISIINVGNTAFLRYSKIFKRRYEPYMSIPVALITDLDLKPDQEAETMAVEGRGNVSKKEIITNDKQIEYDGQSVKTFVSTHWTLEYCLANSPSIGNEFKTIVRTIHSGSNWSDFNSELANKLTSKSLKKTEIAYRLAKALDEDCHRTNADGALDPSITVDEDDEFIGYLIKAIKYACGL